MITLIAEAESEERQHPRILNDLIKRTKGTVRVASAYVTDTDLLSGLGIREVRLLIYLRRMDLIAGASSLGSLRALIEVGIKCRFISKGPRLHAKVYILGDQSAVVTSANLTSNAMENNLEVGVHLSGVPVTELINWFDALWDDKAEDLDLETIAKWRNEIKVEHEEYKSQWKRAADQPLTPADSRAKLTALLDTGKRFFVCNTNQKWDHDDEQRMHDRHYAAAWERFNHRRYMEEVRKGHLIFMYKKCAGIIGIGQAKGPAKKLESGALGRLKQTDKPEWRVPTDWLVWQDHNPFKWPSQNSTFYDVSDAKYKQLRIDIMRHFSIDEQRLAAPIP